MDESRGGGGHGGGGGAGGLGQGRGGQRELPRNDVREKAFIP